MDVAAWLEVWCSNNMHERHYVESKSTMKRDVDACEADAKEPGISPSVLRDAAEGDFAAYLMSYQNSATDAEVNSLAAKDD